MNSALEILSTVSEDRYEKQPWQIEDIKNAGDNFSADWSEMGCYKTTTTLWLAEHRRVKNMLIITSPDGKGTYVDAIPKSLNGWIIFDVELQQVREYVGGGYWVPRSLDLLLDIVKLGHHEKPYVFLMHYDCFSPRHTEKWEIASRFGKIKWDMIAIDEAHRIKNRDTGWTKVIKRELRTHHKRVMTGTGFINNPAEIWSLLNWLDPRGKEIPRANSYWQFRGHFCDEIVLANGMRQIVGIRAKRKDEFVHLRKNLGPRHFMKEVHPDIPEPIHTEYEVELNPDQKRMYREIKAVLQTFDRQGEPITSPNVVSQIMKLRQIAVATPEVIERKYDPKIGKTVTSMKLCEPSSKLDKVMELLEEIPWDDESKRQVVIFSNFKGPLALLEKRFEQQVDKRGRVTREAIPYLHMKESTNRTERYRMWHDIWPQKKHRVFLSTLQLGSESINLAAAEYVIFLDRSWSPKDMIQAVGRCYRPGQTGRVEAIYINATNTIDKKMVDKLTTKRKWFDEIFGT